MPSVNGLLEPRPLTATHVGLHQESPLAQHSHSQGRMDASSVTGLFSNVTSGNWCYTFSDCVFQHVRQRDLQCVAEPYVANVICWSLQVPCPDDQVHGDVRYSDPSSVWVLICSIIVFFMVNYAPLLNNLLQLKCPNHALLFSNHMATKIVMTVRVNYLWFQVEKRHASWVVTHMHVKMKTALWWILAKILGWCYIWHVSSETLQTLLC